MRDTLLDGLLLPLRLYFQPHDVFREIAALAPDMPLNYSLWQARDKLRDPAFRRGIGHWALKGLVALAWALPGTLLPLGLLAVLGQTVDWSQALLGVVSGAVFGVAGSTLWSMTFGISFGVTFGAIGGVAFSVAEGALQSVEFSIVVGVALGIAEGLMGGMAGGIAVAVAVGLLGGVLGGPAAGAALGGASILAVTHLATFPLEWAFSLASRLLLRSSPNLAARLWRLSPVRWDQVIPLPLPGLEHLLTTLYHQDPSLGQAALSEVAAHRYQNKAAYRVLAQLAETSASSATALPELAAFHHELNWLSTEIPLAADVVDRLLGLRDVSREVDEAVESDSAAHHVRRLEETRDMLEALPAPPDPLLAGWSEIVQRALETARQERRAREPIPQVYARDGRPIRPSRHAEAVSPFKGRERLFGMLDRELERPAGERTAFVLTGQHRAGKTSLVLHLPHRLGSHVVPAVVDLRSPALSEAKGTAGLLHALATTVMEEVRRHRGLSLPALDRAELFRNPYRTLMYWLERVDRRMGARTLLLCLDEFEALEEAIQQERIGTRILFVLRSIVQHQRHMALLLTGNRPIDELPEHWASAMAATPLPIGYLEEHAARELVEQPVEGYPAIYEPAAVDRILQLTHCQPFLVQLVCAELIDRMNRARRAPPESRVTLQDVEAVIPDVLERGADYFDDLWHNQVGDDVARRALEVLVETRPEQAELPATDPDGSQLRAGFATLLDREIIALSSDRYHVVVPLMAEYVRRRKR